VKSRAPDRQACRLRILAGLILLLGLRTPPLRSQAVPNAACPPEGCITGVTVTPDGGSLSSLQPNTAGLASFSARNTGNVSTPFTFTCLATALTCGTVTPASFTIAAGGTREVEVQFTSGTGNGRVTLKASNGGSATDQGFYNVTVGPPPNLAPNISLAPHSNNVRRIDGCAASCFDAVWTTQTPAYYTVATPRSFGLTYSSAAARQVPVILFDVTPASGSGAQPSGYKVEVRMTSTGVLQTLANGTTAAYYTPLPTQTARLAAAFDAQLNGLAPGSYNMSVGLTATFPSGSPLTTTQNFNTQVIILDRHTSPFGSGVWPTGVQEYIRTTISGALFVEADGSAFYYAGGAFPRPGGTNAAYSSDNATYVRRTSLDGSYVEFDWTTTKMTKAVDRFGNTTQYFWTGALLDSIKAPLGKAYRLAYTGGKLASATDPTGRTTNYTVNATSGRLVTVRDPDNVATTLSYDANGLLTRVVDRAGGAWDYAYDQLNRVRSVTAPSIPLFSGGSGRPVARLFASEGRAWQPGIPATAASQPKAAIVPDSVRAFVTVRGSPADSVLPVAALTQSGLGAFSAAGAVDGNTGTAAWNTNTAVVGAFLRIDLGAPGRALTGVSLNGAAGYTGQYDVQHSDNATAWTTVAKGFGPGSAWRSTRWSYAGRHRYWRLLLTNQPGTGPTITELAVEASSTAVTAYKLDRFGAPTVIRDPLGASTTIARDSASRPTLITEPNGHQVQTTYSGFLVSQTKDLTTGRATNYGYNARNDVQTITGDTERRDFYYTPLGALSSVYVGNAASSVYPALSATAVRILQQVYNARGQVTAMWRSQDGTALESRWYRAADGNLDSTMDVRGYPTSYKYDAAGRLDTLRLPGVGQTITVYGPMNEVVSKKDPAGRTTLMQYDLNLKLTRVADAKGQVHKVAYNALGQVTARYDVADTTKVDTWGYDAAGNPRTRQTRRGDVIAMTYDAIGHLLTRSGPDFPTETFRYDSAGRWKVGLNANAYDSLSFDPTGRFVSEWQSLAGALHLTTHTYNQRGQVVLRTVLSGGGVYGPKYIYDGATGKLDTVCVLADCAAVDYTQDLYPSFVQFNAGLSNEWNLFTSYTSASVPVSQTFAPSGLSQFNISWTHDSLFYVKSRTAPTVSPGPRRAYAYDPLGQLTNACDSVGGQCLNVMTGDGAAAYSYDAAGNRTDRGVTTTIGAGDRIGRYGCTGIGYDLNGSIASTQPAVGCQGNFWSYVWDASGRLLEAKRNGVSQATFLYDAFGRRVAKTAAGVTQRYVYDLDHVALDLNAANAVTAEYSYYPGTDRLFRMKNASWTGAVLQDPYTGTVRGIVSFGTGAMIKRYAEAPWGATVPDTGVVVRHRFGGHEFDAETGLYFMRGRYYDPKIGRFLSEDPLASGLNLYAYSGSNPVNYADPSGQILVHSIGGGLNGGQTPGIVDEPASGLVPGSTLWQYVYFGAPGASGISKLHFPGDSAADRRAELANLWAKFIEPVLAADVPEGLYIFAGFDLSFKGCSDFIMYSGRGVGSDGFMLIVDRDILVTVGKHVLFGQYFGNAVWQGAPPARVGIEGFVECTSGGFLFAGSTP
jgi:RHS repeat-associated protein